MRKKTKNPNLLCLCGNSDPVLFRRSLHKHPTPPREYWYVCICCDFGGPEDLYVARFHENAKPDPEFVRTRRLKRREKAPLIEAIKAVHEIPIP
jgi:hypothetical protein